MEELQEQLKQVNKEICEWFRDFCKPAFNRGVVSTTSVELTNI